MREKNSIIDNLIKWKSICKVIKLENDIKIIDDIISIVDKYYKSEKVGCVVSKTKKEKDIERLKIIMKGIKEKDNSILLENKFKLINIGTNVEEEWDKLSEGEKNKLSKLELNVIYDILYEPSELKYINKVKSELVSEINYYINNEKRKRILRHRDLI